MSQPLSAISWCPSWPQLTRFIRSQRLEIPQKTMRRTIRTKWSSKTRSVTPFLALPDLCAQLCSETDLSGGKTATTCSSRRREGISARNGGFHSPSDRDGLTKISYAYPLVRMINGYRMPAKIYNYLIFWFRNRQYMLRLLGSV
jgi:hypothetical protein